jgi:hypothetical protein
MDVSGLSHNAQTLCRAESCHFTRQQQDDFAVASYKRAIEAQQQGWFADEIVPVEIKSKKAAITVDKDEGPARFNEEKLRKLSPAFGPQGTVTAGNASSVNDGAAAIVSYEIAKAARICLRKSPYPAIRNLSCECDCGVLVLRGRLSSFYEKQLAQVVISQLPGIIQLANEAEVVSDPR